VHVPCLRKVCIWPQMVAPTHGIYASQATHGMSQKMFLALLAATAGRTHSQQSNDFDECASAPCVNGATCIESSSDSSVSLSTYRCTCAAGFANGVCNYAYLPQYSSECNVLESSSGGGGNCDIDVNECISSPCVNGGSCNESSVRSSIPAAAYSCTCAPGYANGRCGFDYLPSYHSECNVAEPTSQLGGNCDVDIDECASNPCYHDGVCNQAGLVQQYGNWSYEKRYACTCTQFTHKWNGLPFAMPAVPFPIAMDSFLQAQAGESSVWSPATDCLTRNYDDYRCEPGEQPTQDGSGCQPCAAGFYSPSGDQCFECFAPLVIEPEMWWCQRPRLGPQGAILQAHLCERNLRCTACSPGMVANANRTGCVDAMAGLTGTTGTVVASATSSVAAPQAVGSAQFQITAAQMATPAATALTIATGLASAMGINVDELVVDEKQFEPGSTGRRLQATSTIDLQFSLKPGTPSSALYFLEQTVGTPGASARQTLAALGMVLSTFAVNSKCPEGKVQNGADILCHKCPYPEYTSDSENCRRCPEGQVPTEKGDNCRCGDGMYNSSRGFVTCYGESMGADLFELACADQMLNSGQDVEDAVGEVLQYVPDVGGFKSTASEEFDLADCPQRSTDARQACSPCPLEECVSCEGGILRINPGFATASALVESSLPVDALAGARPVFACTESAKIQANLTCLGEPVPNVTAPGSQHWWENYALCNEALEGVSSASEAQAACMAAGACVYTAGIEAAIAAPAQPEMCNGTGPLNSVCMADFANKGGSGQANCALGTCTWSPARAAVPLTIQGVEAACTAARPPAPTWCAAGYEGPLCSNCADGYARGGIDRWQPCIVCGDAWPLWAWGLIGLATIAGMIQLERMACGMEAGEQDKGNGEAPIGVALVIGNGEYENWPSLDAAHTDGVAMTSMLDKLGYTVILIENGSKEKIIEGIEMFKEALVEVTDPDTYYHLQIEDADFKPQTHLGLNQTDKIEVAAIVFYSGHSCQIGGENYLVPSGASLNPTIEECVQLKSLFHAKAATSGPGIFLIDASHRVAAGVLDDTGRDTFRCGISKVLMADPVKLYAEPQGWAYERTVIHKMLETHKQSPMTGAVLEDVRLASGQMADTLWFRDDDLRQTIEAYATRSSLKAMPTPIPNCLLVFAAEPGRFSSPTVEDPTSVGDRRRGLFTNELLKLATGRNSIKQLIEKTRSLVTTGSNGRQMPWMTVDLREDSSVFSLSGLEPIDNDDDTQEELDAESILTEVSGLGQQAVHQANQGEGGGAMDKIMQFLSLAKPAIKQVVGLGQILSGMQFAFSIPYPTAFKEFVAFFKIFAIDIFGVVKMGCLSEWTYYDQFLTHTLMIPAFVGAIMANYKFRDFRLAQKGEPKPGSRPTTAYPHGGQVRQDLLSTSFEIAFTFIFLLYPVVSQTIFQMFMCQELNTGEAMLAADFQVQCDTDKHALFTNLGIIAVLIYPLGIPLAIFFMLWRHRVDLAKEDHAKRDQFDPLVGDYRLGAWYWEALEMLRKIILTGLMIFWARGSIGQLAAGIVVSALFLVASVNVRPFGDDFNNSFKIVTDAAVVVTFNVAILLNDRVDKSLEPAWAGQNQLDTLLLIANLMLPAGVVVFEVGRAKLIADEDEELASVINGIPWPFARYEDGIFRGAKKGENARLADLRRELEKIPVGTLDKKAPQVGVKTVQLEEAHNSSNPKEAIIDVMMEIAKLEGGGWGPCKKEESLVKEVYVDRVIRRQAKLERERQIREQEEAEEKAKREKRKEKRKKGRSKAKQRKANQEKDGFDIEVANPTFETD
jgi:hypothetical protein